jgi:autotransporter translocation and assembly factor TamB
MRRLARWGVSLVVAVGVVTVLAAVGLWLAADSRVVHDLIRRRLLTLLADAVEGDISIGEARGHLGQTLVLEDIRVAVGGRAVVRVPRLTLDYALRALLHGRVHIERATIEGPRIRAVRDATGWRLPKLRAGKGSRTGFAIDVDRLEVRDGRIACALLDAHPVRRFAATDLAANGTLGLEAGRTALRIASLRITPRGIDLSPVRGTAMLSFADGGFDVSGLDVTSARSRITGAGHMAADGAVEARAIATPLAARDLRALVPGLALRTDVLLEAHAHGPRSAVALAGRMDLGGAGSLIGSGRVDLAATPLRHALRARFTRLDPGAALDGLLRAHLDGRVRATGTAFGKNAPITYAVKLGPSDVEGRSFRRVRVAGRGRDGVHRARGRVSVAAGDAIVRARVDLGSLAYRAGVRFAIDHPELVAPGMPGGLAARARVHGRGVTGPSRNAVLHATLDGADLGGIRLTGGTLHARLTADDVRLDHASVEGPGVRLALAGTVDLARPGADLTLEGAADLGAAAAAAGKSGAGTALIHGSIRGPLDGLAVAATADSNGLAYGTLTMREGHAAVDLSDVGGRDTGGTARVDLTGLQLGTRPLALLHAGADWRRRAGVDRVTLDASVRRDDGAAGDVSATLEHTAARTTGRLRDLQVKPVDEPAWRLVRPAGVAFADGLTIDALTLAAGEQQVTLAGHLAARTANDATLTLTRVAIQPLCNLAGGRPCGGTLSGRAQLTGAAASPGLAATFTATDLRVDKVAYGRLDFQARYAERDALVHATLHHPEAGELLLDGHVPVDLAWAGERRALGDVPVDLTLSASQLDLTLLATLAPGTLRRSSGRASVSLRITGPRDAPHADGTIAIDADRVELVAAGVPYTNVRIRLEARGTALHVTEMFAASGDGTLTGEGDIALARGETTAVALRLRFEDFFALRREAFEATVSGPLEVGGTFGTPEVHGHVQVVRAIVRPAALPASGLNLEPDPTITVVKAPLQTESPPPPPPPGVGDRFRVAIEVEIARNAWIRRNDANIELGGELHLDKEPFAPLRISGRVRLLRGWYAFQGRRFDIDRGTITFTGASPLEPVFNVTASHHADFYTVTVHVEGSGDKPTLTLSADPPLEQADILAVLLFGKPVAELGRGQAVGLQDKALDLAAGYVMPELRTSVMNTLGLDALDVQLPGDVSNPGQVRVGRYVTGDVFVSLAHEFGVHAGEVVRVEYSLTRSISVSGSTSTRGASGVDVFWHHRY